MPIKNDTAPKNNGKLRLKHKERRSSGPSAVLSGTDSRDGTQDVRNEEVSSTEQDQPILIFESPEKNVIWLLVLAY